MLGYCGSAAGGWWLGPAVASGDSADGHGPPVSDGSRTTEAVHKRKLCKQQIHFYIILNNRKYNIENKCPHYFYQPDSISLNNLQTNKQTYTNVQHI